MAPRTTKSRKAKPAPARPSRPEPTSDTPPSRGSSAGRYADESREPLGLGKAGRLATTTTTGTAGGPKSTF